MGYARVPMSVRNLIMALMLLIPVGGWAWNTLRNRSFSWSGLMLLAGGSMFMFLGAGLLFGLSVDPSRSLHRSEGRLTYVESYNGVVFDEQKEPILIIPEGPQAYLKEETVTSGPVKTKYRTIPARTYTLYRVLLGSPGPWHDIDSSEDRAEAQARLDELKDFLRGDAPRMVLHEESDEADWVLLMFGLMAYFMGMGVAALGSTVGLTDSHSEPETPRKQRSKHGGSRRGRKGKWRG